MIIGFGFGDPIQRQRAREYAREFDLTDEEIEQRLDEEFTRKI